MMIIVHVAVALLGLVSASVAAVRPSRRKVWLSYGLVVLTLLSGSYLVVAMHAPMLRTCVTGLAYTVITLAMVAVAQRRLARARAEG